MNLNPQSIDDAILEGLFQSDYQKMLGRIEAIHANLRHYFSHKFQYAMKGRSDEENELIIALWESLGFDDAIPQSQNIGSGRVQRKVG